MYWNIILPLSLTLITHSQAGPVHKHHKRGQLPVLVARAELLGNVHSVTTHVKRDLGFQGSIGDHVLLTYGDTMYSDANYTDSWRGMTSDSMAYATQNPLEVLDVQLNEQGYPAQFCPIEKRYGEDASECAMGITNVIETYPGQGILYFLKNHRPGGENHLMGAGVATVTLSQDSPPVPQVNRLSEYWWDGETEPWYGDVGAIRSGDHIYAYGHAKSTPYVYVARVPWDKATDLACYEYWNGETWQTERLYNVNEKEGVFWQVNQGQVVWSNYYGCFMFVYCDNWMNNKVLAKVARTPTGPWSEPVTLYQATPITNGSSIYAAVPHPYYDQTGKSLVVTYTNHPNLIQAVKLTFA